MLEQIFLQADNLPMCHSTVNRTEVDKSKNMPGPSNERKKRVGGESSAHHATICAELQCASIFNLLCSLNGLTHYGIKILGK